MVESPKWITAKEAAAYLRDQGFAVKPPTIRAWIREGRYIGGDRVRLGSTRLGNRLYTQREFLQSFIHVFENLSSTSPIPRNGR